jgi:hypothetical protein
MTRSPSIPAGHPLPGSAPGRSVPISPAIAAEPSLLSVFLGRVAAVVVGLVAFAIAFVMTVLGIIIVILALLVRFLYLGFRWLGAWATVKYRHYKGRTYPGEFFIPLQASPHMVISSAFNSRVAGLLGYIARILIAVAGPLAVVLRSVWGHRAYRERVARQRSDGPDQVTDLPLRGSITFRFVLRSLIDVVVDLKGDWLRDGYSRRTTPYDEWLDLVAKPLALFRTLWYTPGSNPRGFEFAPAIAIRSYSGEADRDPASWVGRYPDPLGFPGIASATIRRLRVGNLRDLFLSAREIDDMCDPDLDDKPNAAVVRVVQTTGTAGRVWIVQIASTQSWNPMPGTAANDFTADIYGVAGRETTLLRGTLDAIELAGIPPDEPVLLTGFSLGGIIAAQLATGEYRLRKRGTGIDATHLLVAGAPVKRFPVSEQVSVLSIEHKIDPVHRLDGRIHVSHGRPPRWMTATAGPPLPLDFTLAHTHHAPSYAETAAAVAELTEAAEFWQGRDDSPGAHMFFQGDQIIRDYAIERTPEEAPATGASTTPRAESAVPVYFDKGSPDGVTRGRLRNFIRRMHGVIAADVYLSRSGFPTTKTWSADILLDDFGDWLSPSRRQFTYGSLIALVENTRSVGLNFRLKCQQQPLGMINASIQRAGVDTWRENLDVDGVLAGTPPFEVMPGGTVAVLIAEGGPIHGVFEYEANPFGGFDRMTGLL